MTPKKLFKTVYNGQPNFITPSILDYRYVGGYATELSHGRGISDQYVYGVTVLKRDGTRCTDLNKLFYTRKEAEDYIESLAVTGYTEDIEEDIA